MLFAVSGIATVILLSLLALSSRTPAFDRSQVLDQCAPPATSRKFSRVFAARTCMMTGVGLTGVFLCGILVRFWVYGKAVVLTSAPLTIHGSSLIAGIAAGHGDRLPRARLWAAGPISGESRKNIPRGRVVAG